MEKSKEDFIKEKMKKLVGEEGYSKSQAYMISLSYWDKRHSAQQGTEWYDNNPPLFTSPNSNLVELSQEDLLNTEPMVNNYDIYRSQEQKQRMYQNSLGVQPNYNNRVNIVDPSIGLSLDYALNFAGRGFGAKNPYQAGIGTGLSLIKGARNFLTGFSEGKETNRVINEMQNKQFEKPKNSIWAQQGKQVTNADIIAKNAITDEGFGNINMEGGEFVLRNTGEVQPVVGEPHIKNGKVADGVNATLNNGDKVISDYVKLRPQDIKELKDRYNISLKKGTTFAQAQKKIDSKLGITELESDKADMLKKFEKLTTQKDTDTKQLNLKALEKVISTSNEKLNLLSGIRTQTADFLFNLQEQQPKKDQSKLYDKNGKVVEEEKDVAQQGRKIITGNEIIDNTINSKELENNGRLRTIKKVQHGVDNDRFGSGAYLYYDKLPTDPGFDYKVNREFISNDAFYNVVVPSAQYQAYMKQQSPQNHITELAQKHGIPLDRAMELVRKQQGGEMDQGQDITQVVVQMLQQGISPEQIVEQLASQGVPQEVIVQTIQGLMQQNQEQESMQMGGEYAQAGYSFSTRYTPTSKDYQIDGSSIINQDTLSGVEEWQPYTGKGYGAKMADVEDTIKVHSWYFDTEEKKDKFREAVSKEGEQPEVKDFQKAYNEELEKRAKKAGVKEEDIKNVVNQVGFSNSGVQKADGLFGAFTSTRPLFDFKKVEDGKTDVIVKEIPNFNTQQQIIEDRVKNIIPNFQPYIPLYSALQPIAKQNVFGQRVDPIKLTPEPMLAEQERQRQADVDRIEQTGMSPQQQEAILAQGLASSQMASNDAISKVENFNAQSQQQADLQNLNLDLKEQIMNNQFSSDYQDKMMASIANQEETLRNIFKGQYLQGVQNRNDVINMNRANMLNDQFAITDTGIVALNNKPQRFNFTTDEEVKLLESMTPSEREAYKKMKILKNNK